MKKLLTLIVLSFSLTAFSQGQLQKEASGNLASFIRPGDATRQSDPG